MDNLGTGSAEKLGYSETVHVGITTPSHRKRSFCHVEENDFFPCKLFYRFLSPQATSQTANVGHGISQEVQPVAQEARGLSKQRALKREVASILNNF